MWDLLSSTFGNPTRGHVRQIKKQIESCVKGTKTISEYLRLVKSKADELALLGKPMDPEDVTERILDGLPEEYKPEIDAINGRDTTIPFHELYERLINREAMLLCKESSAVTPIVEHATDTKTRNHWRNNNNNNNYHQNRGTQGVSQPRFNKPYQGRCQALGAQGHSAKYCPQFRLVPGAAMTTPMHQPRPQ